MHHNRRVYAAAQQSKNLTQPKFQTNSELHDSIEGKKKKSNTSRHFQKDQMLLSLTLALESTPMTSCPSWCHWASAAGKTWVFTELDTKGVMALLIPVKNVSRDLICDQYCWAYVSVDVHKTTLFPRLLSSLQGEEVDPLASAAAG